MHNRSLQEKQQFEPFTRLGLVGQQLSQIQPGALPGVTTVGYQPSAAPASPLASFLGGAAGAGGVLGKLGNIWIMNVFRRPMFRGGPVR